MQDYNHPTNMALPVGRGRQPFVLYVHAGVFGAGSTGHGIFIASLFLIWSGRRTFLENNAGTHNFV